VPGATPLGTVAAAVRAPPAAEGIDNDDSPAEGNYTSRPAHERGDPNAARGEQDCRHETAVMRLGTIRPACLEGDLLRLGAVRTGANVNNDDGYWPWK
jgi:hypothetical protein